MIIDIINENYPLKKKEIGELETYNCSGMTFQNTSYDAIGLGNVSYTKASMPLGIMKMTSLIINPFEVDAPLISLDIVEAMGNFKVYAEIFDTTLSNKFDTTYFKEVANKYGNYADDIAKENWYDNLIVDRIRKYGKIKDEVIHKLPEDALIAYLKALKECPKCNVSEKIKKAKVYSDGLLKHGGPATDPVKKKLGEEKTTELFNKVMFGTEK